MFQITNETIDIHSLRKASNNPQAGAFVVFEGWVRNHNEGKDVSSLEYEVFESLARKEADKILAEAKDKFEILDALAVHRVGHMNIGDIAVWIGVNSKHREAGFRACRYIIDEIKLRLPIWKKEHYVNGHAHWVNCQGCSRHAHLHYTEENYYDKQLRLKNLGIAGQNQLRSSSVLVVGAGGLGCPALTYLASAGIGKITVCDGDSLEISNLHRQTLYSHADIGEYKAVLAKKRLVELNPFISVHAVTQRLCIENAKELLAQHDLVLDCTDNFESKFLLHDTCYFLKKRLVQASIYQNDGQLQSFDFRAETDCLRCTWPEVPDPGSVGNCTDVGVLGVLPGTLGIMQATEALKLLLNWQTTTLSNTLFVDPMGWQISEVKRRKNKNCPLCGKEPTMHDLAQENYGRKNFELDLSEINDQELQKFKFVDIRQRDERNSNAPHENFLLCSSVENLDSLVQSDRPLLLVCQRGVRSKNASQALRNTGQKNVFSLARGVQTLKEHWSRLKELDSCQ